MPTSRPVHCGNGNAHRRHRMNTGRMCDGLPSTWSLVQQSDTNQRRVEAAQLYLEQMGTLASGAGVIVQVDAVDALRQLLRNERQFIDRMAQARYEYTTKRPWSVLPDWSKKIWREETVHVLGPVLAMLRAIGGVS